MKALRNSKGADLLRDVNAAVPKLQGPKEFTIVIKALSRESYWKRAVRILDDMRADGMEPNSFAYNGVIGSLAKAQQWELALSLFREMGSRGQTRPFSLIATRESRAPLV